MNIVLIGYRGTGKSVVGELLAARLRMQCIGMDTEIVKRAGMSIPEIVEKYGWEKFRDIESEEAREVSGFDNVVIDTGGGVIERPVSRIHGDTERPALTAGKTFTEEVTEVLERRIPKYKSAAKYEIDTDELTPEQVADRIIKICKMDSA
ncbi:MAG: shikimate kinase [Deltaproteobacteria bacterium]|nr:shikimate kinase [Deltaproteobacteria bacterium]